MVIRLGNNGNPDKLYLGSNAVSKVYKGSQQVWPAISAGTPGTFRVRTSVVDQNWSTVSDGDMIETVAPGRIRVWVDNFAGWANNDPREILVDVDYGERYDLRYTDHVDLPDTNVLRRLSGTQAGYYPGVLSGHSMRGTDIAGNQVLTSVHDQGGGAPIGTLDQTVTVRVSDGLAVDTISFTVRLIHPDVYYADRLKTLYPTAPEPERYGTVYISRDGDFSDAPDARAAAASLGGIFHLTIADGEFSTNQLRTLIGLKWYNETSATRVLFKAGETFYPVNAVDPISVGINGQLGTWYHTDAGGDDDAILDAARLATFNPGGTASLLRSNSFVYTGVRITNLVLQVSDYDVSDETWREWWNVVRYTNKVGTVTENSQDDLNGGSYNGETLSNGNGIYTQVVSDDGAGTLICRQVVDTADVDDGAAEQAYFVDGDTLTGQTGGATMTFVATGSRQDRTRKCSGAGIYLINMKGLLLDGVQIFGAETGIAGLGVNSVLVDVLIKNYWNYGAQVTGGGAETSWSEVGVVTVQPLSYEGTPRDFGGASVSGNRNYFNAMIDGTDLATNDISHAHRRFTIISEYSAHYCFASTYGGHGGGHQPMHRLSTGGAEAEGDLTVQFYGCGYSGGNSQIQFSSLGSAYPPFTPAVIRVENCHLHATFASGGSNINVFYTNYILRNCLLDQPTPAYSVSDRAISWVGAASEASYNTDPDENAVQPIIEFCTLTGLINSTPDSSIASLITSVRAVPVVFRNNAFVINQSLFDSISAGVIAMADAPADFDAQLRPLVTATNAYQSATGTIVAEDATGRTRSASDPSKGAFEPS